MREIKFRAWDSYKKKMDLVKGISFFDDGSIGYYKDPYCVDYLPADDDCIMQYTGLKDKNGKEIYEGDIVAKYGAIYECMWSEGDMGWYFRATNCKSDWGFPRDCTVIGNIHENPELLEDK